MQWPLKQAHSIAQDINFSVQLAAIF